MALLSSLTTSIPSTPLALKRFVHVIRYPYRQRKPQLTVTGHQLNIGAVNKSGNKIFILILFPTWGSWKWSWLTHLTVTSHVQDFSLVTSSNFVCWQGKEKVNPTGSFLSLMLCFSMKSPRHSATWSNSWSRRERERDVVIKSHRTSLRSLSLGASAYSRAAAVDDVLRSVVNLTLHLHRLLLLMAHAHVEDPEVTSSQIQSNEVSLFYGKNTKGFFELLLNEYKCTEITKRSTDYFQPVSKHVCYVWCTAALQSVPTLIIVISHLYTEYTGK